MASATDYRDSHKEPGKGRSYDRDFQDLKYRRYFWVWEQQVLRHLLQTKFPGNREIRYLDFACGTGRILAFLEDHVSSAWGVDLSDEMLKVARQSVTKSKLITADLTQTDPFQGQTFDLITAFRFFLNAQADLREQVMKVLARLLKPDGFLVLNVHMNHSSLLAKLVRTKRRLRGLDPYAFNTLAHEEMERLAAVSGLQIVETYHRGVIPIKNENPIIPMWAIHPFEAFASRIPAMRAWSRYVVYVCRSI